VVLGGVSSHDSLGQRALGAEAVLVVQILRRCLAPHELDVFEHGFRAAVKDAPPQGRGAATLSTN
jgi:hypothetical protein